MSSKTCDVCLAHGEDVLLISCREWYERNGFPAPTHAEFVRLMESGGHQRHQAGCGKWIWLDIRLKVAAGSA